MKILMINGSPHPRGCTYTALHEMEQVLQAAGVETQILTVGAEQAGGCTACGGCNATGHCVRGGLVNDAIDAMETADALVLASPVHYAGILLSYRDNGLARKVPTIEVNSRRHHAFIRSKKNWPPSIRHQLLKIFPVDWLAPMEKAAGAV